jgi:hypothetical protein
MDSQRETTGSSHLAPTSTAVTTGEPLAFDQCGEVEKEKYRRLAFQNQNIRIQAKLGGQQPQYKIDAASQVAQLQSLQHYHFNRALCWSWIAASTTTAAGHV